MQFHYFRTKSPVSFLLPVVVIVVVGNLDILWDLLRQTDISNEGMTFIGSLLKEERRVKAPARKSGLSKEETILGSLPPGHKARLCMYKRVRLFLCSNS
jgi:hypothetical protein